MVIAYIAEEYVLFDFYSLFYTLTGCFGSVLAC